MARTQLAKRKTPRFKYSDVVVSDQKKCEDAIDRIFGYQRRMASDVVAIGCLLIDVKEKLEHGQFGAWIKHYLGWSQQTISNMMRAGETFGKVPNFGDLTIDTSALTGTSLAAEITTLNSKSQRVYGISYTYS